MQDADSRPVADRAESARHARSNYFLYLAGTGAGVFAGVFFEFFDTGGQELAGSTMLMVGGLIGLFAFIVVIIGVARAYMGRKKGQRGDRHTFQGSDTDILDLLALLGRNDSRRPGFA